MSDLGRAWAQVGIEDAKNARNDPERAYAQAQIDPDTAEGARLATVRTNMIAARISNDRARNAAKEAVDHAVLVGAAASRSEAEGHLAAMTSASNRLNDIVTELLRSL